MTVQNITELIDLMDYSDDDYNDFTFESLTELLKRDGEKVLEELRDIIEGGTLFYKWKIGDVLYTLGLINDEPTYKSRKELLLSCIDNFWVSIRDGAISGLIEMDDPDLPHDFIESCYKNENHPGILMSLERLLSRC